MFKNNDSKGKGAERMEAMAQVISCLTFDPNSIKNIEITWEAIRCDGLDELVPVFRMESHNSEAKEIIQIDKTQQ